MVTVNIILMQNVQKRVIKTTNRPTAKIDYKHTLL